MKNPHSKCKICGKEHALGGCPEFISVAKASSEQTEGITGRKVASPRREMRVGESGAPLTATSEFTDVTAGETALLPNPSWYNGVDPFTGHEPPPKSKVDEIIQKHNERLAYQAKYQRDLRAATKLGISVKEFREAKGKEE